MSALDDIMEKFHNNIPAAAGTSAGGKGQQVSDMAANDRKKIVFIGGPLPAADIKSAFRSRRKNYRLKFVPEAEAIDIARDETILGLFITAPLPGAGWREFIKKFKFLNGQIPVIVLQEREDETMALQALSEGAYDCVAMDWPGFAGRLPLVLEKAAARSAYDANRHWLESIVFENHTRWLAFFDAITDFIFMVDENERILKINAALASAYGKHPKDVTGMKWHDFLGYELAGELKALRSNNVSQPAERKIRDDYYLISVFPLRYEEQDLTIYFLKNITEMRRLKDQLFYSDKLASIGLLVSGVAHEINNPLTGIIAYTELLKMRATDEDQQTVAGKIMASAERCRKIVENLLTFSRQRTLAKSFESINDIIDRTVELRSYWLRMGGVEIVRDFAQVPALFMDTQQMQQVLLNILINAEQAISDAGVEKGRIEFKTSFDPDSRRVTVRITDNGAGISEQIIDKIFDPFFTTKPVGIGTGLGLSISHGIIGEHGGSIRVERPPEGGCRFIIEVPQKQTDEIMMEQGKEGAR